MPQQDTAPHSPSDPHETLHGHVATFENLCRAEPPAEGAVRDHYQAVRSCRELVELYALVSIADSLHNLGQGLGMALNSISVELDAISNRMPT